MYLGQLPVHEKPMLVIAKGLTNGFDFDGTKDFVSYELEVIKEGGETE